MALSKLELSHSSKVMAMAAAAQVRVAGEGHHGAEQGCSLEPSAYLLATVHGCVL